MRPNASGDPSIRALSTFLRETCPDATLVERLKIVLRPYICPFDIFLPLIPQGASVFDIGCGAGQFLLLVEQFRAPSRVMGIEIDDRLVMLCEQQFSARGLTNATVARYDGEHLPEDIVQYDIITMLDVLHHIPPEQQLPYLTALADTMRPGQQLLMKEIDADSPLVFFNKLHDRIISHSSSHERSAVGVRAWAQQAGLREIHFSTMRRAVYPHFTLMLQKA